MSKQPIKDRQNARLILEELEERRLFSGGIEGLIDSGLDAGAIYRDAADSPGRSSVDTAAGAEAEHRTRELVFVDTRVDDYEALVDSLARSSDRSHRIEVVVLERERDGIEQMSAALASYGDLDAVHIISHGSDGSLQLGGTVLDAATLEQNQAGVALWANAFAETGDILIYGCNLAASEAGQLLVARLADLTLTDVAASDDPTGHQSLGGDWQLEHVIGSVESEVAVSAETRAEWQTVLAATADDDFAYPTGNLGGNGGGNGWAGAWGGTRTQVVATGLAHPSGGLETSGGAVRLDAPAFNIPSFESRDLASSLGDVSETVWASFLLQPDETTDPDNSYMGLAFGTGGAANTDQLFVGYSGTNFKLNNWGGGGVNIDVPGVVSGQTYFLVLKLDLSATGNDSATLYVNPTAGLGSPDVAGSAVKSDLDLGSFSTISIAGGRDGANNDSLLDQIRIGSSYAEVAPLDTGSQQLWFSTDSNVGAPGADGLPGGWSESEVLEFGGAGFTHGAATSGQLSQQIDFSTFTADPVDTGALHYVNRDVTIGSGANSFDLQVGDVLVSFLQDETVLAPYTASGSNELYEDGDLLLFRPTTAGDYSNGTFHLLLDDVVSDDLKGVTLIEEDTVIGGTSIKAGSFLVIQEASATTSIDLFVATGIGEGTTSGTTTPLIDLAGLGIDANRLRGIEVVERDMTIGGQFLSAGSILATLNVDDNVSGVGSNNLPVDQNDVFVLDLTSTGPGTTTGTATMFLDGSDIGLDDNPSAENPYALALYNPVPVPSTAPMITSPSAVNVVENTTAVTTVTASDADGDSPSYAITGGIDQAHFSIDPDTGVLTFVAAPDFDSPADSDGNNVYVVEVTASDGVGGLAVQTINVSVTDVNEAPVMASWFNDAWDSRKELTIDSAQVAGDVSDFPVLISLNVDAELAAQALANGDDIVFTAADGVTQLAHETEYFDETTGELRAWVKTDLSGSVDTDIYMYFGNAAATNQQNAAGVWAEYVGVYHLSEAPSGAPGELVDSSGSGNHATTEGAMNAADSVATTIGRGLAFDGVDDVIRIPDSASLDGINDAATFSLWINFVDAADGDHQIVMASSNRYSETDGYEWASQGDGDHFFYPDAMTPDVNYNLGANPFTNGAWHHLAATMDFATKEVRIYIDGTPMTFTYEGVPGNWTSLSSSDDLLFGGNPDRATRFFDGMMDEIRIADAVRSQAWIQTEVNNQSAPGTFFSVGVSEAREDRLTDIAEDEINSAGDSVQTIIDSSGADRITDDDSGAVEGIAVTAVDDSNGQWQYDANADGSWLAFGAVSDNDAVLLDTNALIRFVPDPDYNGSAGDLTFRAWDQTAGANGDINVDVSTSGGSSAYSSASFDATLSVVPQPDPAVVGGADTGAVTEDVGVVGGNIATGGSLTIADPDAGESSFQAATINGTYGDLIIDAAGNWSYSADNSQAAIQALDAGESLIDALTVTTFDGTTHDVLITINGAEDAPVIGGTATGAVTEDATLTATNTLTITDTDTSDNPVSFDDVAPTLGDNGYGDFEITGNTWTYTLDNGNAAVQALDVGETLTDTYSFTASDGSTQTVTVTIDGAEDAPSLDNPIADQNATESAAFSYTFPSNAFGDVDASDSLAFSAALAGGGPLPAWLAFDGPTRTFSGTPGAADIGALDIRVTADDGSSTVDDVFTLTVAPFNNLPVIGGADRGAVTEDRNLAAGQLTESGALSIADPDPGESSFVAATVNGALGTLVIDAAGNWTYSADNDQPEIQSLDSGESISDVLTVTTADGTTHDVVITINGAVEALAPPPLQPPAPEPPPGVDEPDESPEAEPQIVTEAPAAPPGIVRIPQETVLPERNEPEYVAAAEAQPAAPPERPAVQPAASDRTAAIPPLGLNIEQLKLQVSDDAAVNDQFEHALQAHIERMHAAMDQDGDRKRAEDIEVQILTGTSVSLTAGVVSWVLRGGSLLASLMSTVPLLNRFDPLPILKSRGEREKVAAGDEAADDTRIPEHEQRVDALFGDNEADR